MVVGVVVDEGLVEEDMVGLRWMRRRPVGGWNGLEGVA